MVDSAAGAPGGRLAPNYGDGVREVTTALYSAPGTHTITVQAADLNGRVLGAAITRTFRIAEEPYSVRALPDLGAGAGATWIHPSGIRYGLDREYGAPMPALWRAGALQVIPVPDSLPDDLAAIRTNTAGDVLVQDDSAAANTRRPFAPDPFPLDVYGRGASLRRADGVWLRLGPVHRGSPSDAAICCVYARELLESRRALGASYNPPAPASAGAVFDVARGATVDSSLTVRLLVMNAAGQMAGSRTVAGGYSSARPSRPSGSPCRPFPTTWVGRARRRSTRTAHTGRAGRSRRCGEPPRIRVRHAALLRAAGQPGRAPGSTARSVTSRNSTSRGKAASWLGSTPPARSMSGAPRRGARRASV